MIHFPNERRRGGKTLPAMGRFSKVIEDLGLRDIPLQGVLLPGEGVEIVALCPDLTVF